MAEHLRTISTVTILIAGQLDLFTLNPYAECGC